MQSEESQLAVQLLDPKPGESVLDVCAGRGVKTGAIVQRGPSRVYALDDDASKLAMLAQEMVRIDGLLPEVVCTDGTRPYSVDVPELFDAVLVDAPCSGIGTIGRRADLRWAKSATDPVRLAPTQIAILRQAAAAVKPGGRLLYVTCSTDAREDEDVVRAFVAQHPDFRAAALQIAAPPGAIVAIDAFALSVPGIDGADGFFYAKLERSRR
jgi:16S rRNA (cytosine967-C5)-methyltransferase